MQLAAKGGMTVTVVVLLCVVSIVVNGAAPPTTLDYFINHAETKLYNKDRRSLHYGKTKAKNVVLITVEGLDSNTMKVAREVGRKQKLVEFENSVLSDILGSFIKSDSRDYTVADVAAANSAMFNGVPEYNGQMGWSEQEDANCTEFNSTLKRYSNLFKVMSEAGKLTALITQESLTYPGVAGMYASVPDLRIKSDKNLKESGCDGVDFNDIAAQLTYSNKFLNLIIGGGREHLLASSVNDSITQNVLEGAREDLDLTTYWAVDKLLKGKSQVQFVGASEVKTGLDKFATNDYFLGLVDENTLNGQELINMFGKAVMTLETKARNTEQGYFMVAHYNEIAKTHKKGQVSYIDNAYAAVLSMVEILKGVAHPEETLVVVVSTQGSTLTMASGMRLESMVYDNGRTENCDLYPYVSYTLGADREVNTFLKSQEVFGGSDLPLFAFGPSEHIFRGLLNFQDIYHNLLYATCLHPKSVYFKHCTPAPTTTAAPPAITTPERQQPPPSVTQAPSPPYVFPVHPSLLPRQPVPHVSGNPYSSVGLRRVNPNVFNNQRSGTGSRAIPNSNPNLNAIINLNLKSNLNANPNLKLTPNAIPNHLTNAMLNINPNTKTNTVREVKSSTRTNTNGALGSLPFLLPALF